MFTNYALARHRPVTRADEKRRLPVNTTAFLTIGELWLLYVGSQQHTDFLANTQAA